MNAVTRIARKEVTAALRRAVTAADIAGLSDAELLSLFRESPFPAQVLGESRAARQRRREELVTKKESALAAHDRGAPALARKCEVALAELTRAETALAAARRAFGVAHTELDTHGRQHTYAVSAIDAELKALAPAAIDAFIARMESEQQALRSTFDLVAMNLPGGEEAAQRNAERGLRIEGCDAAIAAAEQLRLTSLDGDELAAELKAVEANMADLAKAARAARGLK